MSQYAALLETMMHAILNDERNAAASLYRPKNDFGPEEQLAVYQHGYRQRLRHIMGNMYTATRYTMGAEAFHAAVDGFITAVPSRSYNIDLYPLQFAGYIAQITEDVLIQELARLEAALRDVARAADEPSITKDFLKLQTAETLTDMPLALRAGTKLMQFSYPLSPYVRAIHKNKKPKRPGATAEWMMLVSHAGDMRHTVLTQAEFVLLTLIAEGLTLGKALGNEQFAPFVSERLAKDFQRWFSHWINEGFFALPK